MFIYVRLSEALERILEMIHDHEASYKPHDTLKSVRLSVKDV